MNQTIGPEKDKEKETEEIIDDWGQEADRIRRKFMPYQRHIMIYGLIILIFLVVFLGYAYGGLKVCSDLDGLLDSKFKCHPNYKPNVTNPNQPVLPNIILNVS